MTCSAAGEPAHTVGDHVAAEQLLSDEVGQRITITVLATQARRLRAVFDEGLSVEECYSAAAIAVLLYLDGLREPPLGRSPGL